MSFIGTIRAKIKTHLEAMLDSTSAAWFKEVYDDMHKETTQTPVATFVIGGGTNHRPDFNAHNDVDHELQIWIEADTLATTEDILVAVQGLWLDNTLMNEMSDVGVINVTVTDTSVPVPVEGENRFFAVAVFNLHIRFDYT